MGTVLNNEEELGDTKMMKFINLLDSEDFRRQGYKVIDFIADYYKEIEQYPVLSHVEPGYLQKILQTSPPKAPETLENILKDVKNHILPGITHWQSPNFFAYFAHGSSIASFIGEMLGIGLNVVGFSWFSSPAATELEMVVMDWFGEMLSLPKHFLFSSFSNDSSGGSKRATGGGVLLGTTCEAIICTMVAARDQKLKQIGRKKVNKLTVYESDQTHMSFKKAAKIAGISPENIRSIKTTKSEKFMLSPKSLKLAIQSDIEKGFIPLFLCATIGTTATNAVDPLDPLCELAKENDMWVHIDAAYAGSSCICPEYRHFIDGVEKANSFSLNAHKWFFSAPDCCCLWVKDSSIMTNSLSVNPQYLRNRATDSKQVVDYKDWQATLSRRFRALKLWVVLKSYGVEKLQSFLRYHIKLARIFEDLVSRDDRFEIIVQRNFSLVCFRLISTMVKNFLGKLDDRYEKSVEEKTNKINMILLESINLSGKVHMTHAIVEGVYMIRFAVGTTMTEELHVRMAWKVLQQSADHLIASEALVKMA